MREYQIQCDRGTDRTEDIHQLEEEIAKVGVLGGMER